MMSDEKVIHDTASSSSASPNDLQKSSTLGGSEPQHEHGLAMPSHDGTLLGKILLPATVSNLTFGGRNRSQLFLCASHSLYTISTNQRGAQWP